MIKKNFILIFLAIALIPFSLANLGTGVDGVIGVDLGYKLPGFNNNTAYVNNSLLFDGYSVSSLWTYYTGLGNWCQLTGCTMSGNLTTTGNLTANKILGNGLNITGTTLLTSGNTFVRDIFNETHHLNVDLENLDRLYANVFLTPLVIETFSNATGDYINISAQSGETSISFNLASSTNSANNYRFSYTNIALPLTAGTNETPIKNNVYVYLNAGVPTWAVSTTEPTVQHAMASRVLLGDSGTVPYSAALQEDGQRGFLKRVERVQRLQGLQYLSGFDYVADSGDLQINNGTYINGIYDQDFEGPINLTQGFYLVRENGDYTWFNSFNDILQYSDGTLIGNNKYFNVVFGITPYDGKGNIYAVVQSAPITDYTSVSLAYADSDNTVAVYPVEDFLRISFLPVARMIIQKGGLAKLLPNGGYAIDYRGGVAGGTSSGGGLSETDPIWTVDKPSYVPYTGATNDLNLTGKDLIFSHHTSGTGGIKFLGTSGTIPRIDSYYTGLKFEGANTYLFDSALSIDGLIYSQDSDTLGLQMRTDPQFLQTNRYKMLTDTGDFIFSVNNNVDGETEIFRVNHPDYNIIQIPGTLDLGTNTITDGSMTGNWDYGLGNITANYYYGNGSQLTDLPTPDLSGYRTLSNNSFDWLNVSSNPYYNSFNNKKLASWLTGSQCDPDMIAFWRFNRKPFFNDSSDNFGGSNLDTIGNFNEGSWNYISGPSINNLGDTIKFTTGSYFNVSDPEGRLSLNGSYGFTIEFWIRADSASGDADLINKTNYRIKWDKINPILAKIEATVSGETLTTGTNLKPASSYHVALTLNSSGNLKLYIDGILVNSTTGVSPPAFNTDDFKIGNAYVGSIDELAIYQHTIDTDSHQPADSYITKSYTKSLNGDNYCTVNKLWDDIGGVLTYDGDIHLLSDLNKFYFGGSKQHSIYSDGTNMVINPQEIASGKLKVLGDVNITGEAFINGVNISTLGGASGIWENVSHVATYDGNVNVTGNITSTNSTWGYYNSGNCIVIGDLAHVADC